MRLFVLTSLVACSALAQTAAVDSTDLSRGTTLLPGSSAWADEATALIYNPAGLTYSGRGNAWYVHERSNTRGLNADSAFVSTSVFDLGIGVGVESLRPVDGPARTRTLFGLSYGTPTISAGFTFSGWRGGPVDRLMTMDVGVQSRPLRWLSLGAQVRNLTTPANAQTTLGREWTLGLGLRPLNERVSIGVDWVVPETTPLAASRLQYTVNATLTQGLRVQGGVSHGFQAAQPLYFQVGVGIDLEHFGYTQGVSFSEANVNWQFAARVSADAYGSIVPARRIAVVSLSDLTGTSGGTLGSLLGVAAEDRYLKFLHFLERAARDPELAGVILKVEGTGLGLARADEVRAGLVALKQAGKKVYAYVLSAGDAEYLAISACDGIYAAPEAMVQLDGLRSSVMFFGGAAKLLGIQVDVARVGSYKNFPDQFTRFDMSAEQRETIDAYLDTSVKTIAARVEAGRKLTPASWKAITDEGLKPTRRELQLGTLDGVVTPQQFDEVIREKLPDARVTHGYRPFDARDDRWGKPTRIAIVPVIGGIGGGKNGSSPLTGQSAGAESFISAITDAANDPDVAAIVVRVDSGGGDGLASDLMYRAVLEAKKRKPVVASMGDVAASGGYYVAMGADEIWASPTTLTGSIGVFYARPSIRELAEKLGVTEVTIERGKLSGLTDQFNPWTDDERKAAQRWVDDFYDTFITEAATSRKTSKQAIDAVARGRVWSGEDARAHGLVDHLGGLMEAIASAKKQANVGDDVELEVVQNEQTLLGSLLGATAPSSLLQTKLPQTALPPMLEGLAQKLGPTAWLLETTPRVQARMEWVVDVH